MEHDRNSARVTLHERITTVHVITCILKPVYKINHQLLYKHKLTYTRDNQEALDTSGPNNQEIYLGKNPSTGNKMRGVAARGSGLKGSATLGHSKRTLSCNHVTISRRGFNVSHRRDRPNCQSFEGLS